VSAPAKPRCKCGAVATVYVPELGEETCWDCQQAAVAESQAEAQALEDDHDRDRAGGSHASGEPQPQNGEEPEETGRMRFLTLAQLREKRNREPRFLIEQIWPEDAYGVLGATDKAGKTWATLDLGCSTATGGKWLDRYQCLQGPVVLLFGEGGERNLWRRLEAICRSRDYDLAELEAQDAIRTALAVPRLNQQEEIDAVARQLDRFRPKVTLLDPLYLAASGGTGRDLYAMGESLQAIQELCQEAGSALVVSTHWNQGGEGSGPERFTGVGPSAWGRVLGSGEVEQERTEPDGRSVVTVRWEFSGGEIPNVVFRMRRQVRVDDPLDLASPMHYEAEVIAEGVQAVKETDLTETQARVLAALRELNPVPGTGVGTKEIGDRLAEDGQGYPLKKRTIQKALQDLVEKKLADSVTEEGKEGRWWVFDEPSDRA
jgi:hypothetical protein